MSAIAFIGLGQMGAPMAMNLLKQGHQLNVFDVNPQAVQALAVFVADDHLDAALDGVFRHQRVRVDRRLREEVVRREHAPLALDVFAAQRTADGALAARRLRAWRDEYRQPVDSRPHHRLRAVWLGR